MAHLVKYVKKNRFLVIVFGINFAIALLSFAYFMIKGGGLITLDHDFDAQEIPFNIFCNQAIKTGNIFWNWNIDIGSDFVNTFSFYNLGSPFFWITLLFPATAFPYLVGWIYMLKYAAAGLFSYLFIHRFVKSEKMALIGSMLYAFSGFQSCNLTFYHFHDAVAFFPLLLIGLEKLIVEKKKGYLAFAVFINALLNYFFFIGEVFFLIIYYVVRFLLPECKTLRTQIKVQLYQVIHCLIEGVIGLMMAAILFLPSIISVLQNSRVSNHITGSQALIFDTQNILFNLKGMFFPSEVMENQSAMYDSNWYSISAYLPLVGMALVLVYLCNKKRTWISNLLKVCLVLSVVPLLNNMFAMFTDEYYRRWYYMPVLIMALASAMVIEKREEYKLKKPFVITLVIMVGYVIYMTLYPWKWSDSLNSPILRPVVFTVICGLGIVGVLLTYIVLKYSKRYYYATVVVLTALFCIATTGLNLYSGRHDSWYASSQDMHSDIVQTGLNLKQDVLPYRYKIFDWYNNRALCGSLPSRNSFISTVSPSITDFYNSLGEMRHVVGPEGPEGTNEVLSVAYYVSEVPWSDPVFSNFNNGFRDIYEYRDSNALPIGYTYDTYMLKSDFLKIDSSLRGMAMLKTLIIDDSMEGVVSKTLRKYDSTVDGGYAVADRTNIKAEHSKEVSQQFWYNTKGFGSVIHAETAKYAYYSVPYSTGWAAKVNGEKVDIVNINGLMAVKISAGDNQIVFSYHNVFLTYGSIITIVGILIFLIYVVSDRIYFRKKYNK